MGGGELARLHHRWIEFKHAKWRTTISPKKGENLILSKFSRFIVSITIFFPVSDKATQKYKSERQPGFHQWFIRLVTVETQITQTHIIDTMALLRINLYVLVLCFSHLTELLFSSVFAFSEREQKFMWQWNKLQYRGLEYSRIWKPLKFIIRFNLQSQSGLVQCFMDIVQVYKKHWFITFIIIP